MKKYYTLQDVKKMSEEELLKIIHDLRKANKENETLMRLIDEGSIFSDIMYASNGKRNRESVQRVLGGGLKQVTDPESSVRKEIRYIQLMLLLDTFHPRKHKPVHIIDKKGKEREIIVPPFATDAILHHTIIRLAEPYFMQGMYPYSCACITGRGVHFAKNYVEHVIRSDPKNTKYVLSIDIHDFFHSIPHRELKKKVKKRIKDKTIRSLLFRVIDSCEEGLPLGFYTSQWLANFYLEDLDHYIKERILDNCDCNTKRTGRHGAVYYARYMDDMVMLGPNKRELQKMLKEIKRVLEEDYHLTLKDNYQVFRFIHYDKKKEKEVGKFLDFVGFRFYRDRTILRKSVYKNLLSLMKEVEKDGARNLTPENASKLISYYGLIMFTDAQGLYTNHIKPVVDLKQIKKVCKREQRRKKLLAEDLRDYK